MKTNNRAFTLVEILVAVAISVMLCGAVLGTYIMVERFYATNILGQNLQRDADILMDKIIKGKTIEPGGFFRLSEATSFLQLNINNLRFKGSHFNCGGYKLSANGVSVIHYFVAGSSSQDCFLFGNEQDDVIYTTPKGAALTLRFWEPVGAQYAGIDVGVDVAISQKIVGKTVSGSATTMLNIRNHPT
jgi:prepilin-type N-terminal cleavage/methylation domain-containing protein